MRKFAFLDDLYLSRVPFGASEQRGPWHSSWSRRQHDHPTYTLLRLLSGNKSLEAIYAWPAVYSSTLQCCPRTIDLTAWCGPI